MANEHFTRRLRLRWLPERPAAARAETPAAALRWRDTMRARLLACAAVFGIWAGGLEARLVYLQVADHAAMTARANKQQMRTVVPAAKRGDIVDRNGRILALSADAETIGADPAHIVDPVNSAQQICAALESCDGERLKDLTSRLADSRSRFEHIARQVSPAVAARVRALKLPGVVIFNESRRYYPKKELAAHILGYVGVDNIGLGGLESTYDARIKGRAGRIILQIDSRREARAAREERPATAGDSLELTIDQYLQHIAERELRAGVREHRAAAGTAIIMDPRSGEILALANYPTFNPNAFREITDTARKNRAIQDTYEPGSTFKVVTASAALEEGLLRTSDPIDCAPGFITFPGRKIYDVHPYKLLSFEDVIVMSSNVGAIKAGLKIGPERLGRYINRFGFGQTLSPDFRGESSGIVWKPESLDDSGLASVSMGYQISVTPLQMVSAVSSVANGGTLYEPRIVRAFIRNGHREPIAPKALRQTVSAGTAATLTSIMEAVVERGTAKSAQIEGFKVAGKTGTAARIVNGRYSNVDYNTSFVGFVPSRKPALAIIVMIEAPHGPVAAYGGTVAAPVFQRIAEASLRHLGVPPTINAPSPVLVAKGLADPETPIRPAVASAAVDMQRVLEPARAGLMPDMRGMSARSAVITLNRLGLTATLSGHGFVVDHLPAAGTALVPGETVRLTLARRLPAMPAGGPQQ